MSQEHDQDEGADKPAEEAADAPRSSQGIGESLANAELLHEPGMTISAPDGFSADGGSAEPVVPDEAVREKVLPVPLTQDALAHRFVLEQGKDWRHVHSENQWYRWDGVCWQPDARDLSFETVRMLCREEAASMERGPRVDRLCQRKTMEDVRKIAASDPKIAVGEEIFDQDPMVLNTLAGTVDLRTGAIGPHRRENYITKLARVRPAPGCPGWNDFLHTIMGGDVEKIGYLQRIFGYAATGVPREHAAFFFHGRGNNGKSVCLNLIGKALGSYATNARVELLLETPFESHPTDIAALKGARLVSFSEAGEGRRWNASMLKALTGGDMLAARKMRQDTTEFRPQCTIFITSNHRPEFRETGPAIRRRFFLVHFDQDIPEEATDRYLEEKLEKELDGIAWWIIQGAVEYHEKGLAPPDSVLAETKDYFDEEDKVGQWISENCVQSAGVNERTRVLYQDFCLWAGERGESLLSEKRFSQGLADRGFRKTKSRKGAVFHGIALGSVADGREDGHV